MNNVCWCVEITELVEVILVENWPSFGVEVDGKVWGKDVWVSRRLRSEKFRLLNFRKFMG
jgi:hypothetical protein